MQGPSCDNFNSLITHQTNIAVTTRNTSIFQPPCLTDVGPQAVWKIVERSSRGQVGDNTIGNPATCCFGFAVVSKMHMSDGWHVVARVPTAEPIFRCLCQVLCQVSYWSTEQGGPARLTIIFSVYFTWRPENQERFEEFTLKWNRPPCLPAGNDKTLKIISYGIW